MIEALTLVHHDDKPGSLGHHPVLKGLMSNARYKELSGGWSHHTTLYKNSVYHSISLVTHMHTDSCRATDVDLLTDEMVE